MKCDKCKNKEYCDCHSHDYDACVEDGYASYEPITNADHIRSMTDEELADFLDKTDPVFWNRETWLKWLKQEAT